MKSDKSRELKVGLVSIVAMAILLAGISLGKGWLAGAGRTEVTIRFPRSAGLKESDPVVVNGVRRGTVREVVNDNGSVLVKAAIDNVNDFRKDVSAKIYILEVTGGKKVEIDPGTSPDHWQQGHEISGTTPADLSDLVALVGEMSGSLTKLVSRLDTLTGAANSILSDNRLAADLRATASNAADLTGALNSFLSANKSDIAATIRDLRGMTGSLKSMISKNEPGLSSIVEKLDRTLTDAGKIAGRADTTVASANKLIANLDEITRELRYGSGFATKALFDKNFAVKFDSTMADLSSLLSMIRSHGINVNVRLGTRP